MPHALVSPKSTHRPGVPAARTPLGVRLAIAALAFVVGGTLLCGLLGLVEMHAQDAVIALLQPLDAADSLAGAESALHAAQHR